MAKNLAQFQSLLQNFTMADAQTIFVQYKAMSYKTPFPKLLKVSLYLLSELPSSQENNSGFSAELLWFLEYRVNPHCYDIGNFPEQPVIYGTFSHRVQYRWGGGESYFPYILLNEIQTMFSQLAKRSAMVLPADLCIVHAHYVKNHRSTVLRKIQKHGSRIRDCFSLLCFGNSQIY